MTNLTETSKEDMEKVLVGRGSTHRVEVEVEEPGTVIRSKGGTGANRLISCHDCIACFFYRWEFLTNDYDIGFGLFLKSDVSRWRGLRVSTVVSSKTALCVVDTAEDCN